MPQNFSDMAAVKCETSPPAIHKPVKQLWFSPHPSQNEWKSFLILKDESDQDTNYVISPTLKGELGGECMAKVLVPCILRQGSVFFWPIRLPGPDGKLDKWNQSALGHATSNGNQWIRLQSNMETKSYDIIKPVNPLDPPEWPDDLTAVYKRAVTAVLINSLDHPVVKSLRGEI